MSEASPRLRVVTVLFDQFELLDVTGPLEVLGLLPDRFQLTLIGPQLGPVSSKQGPRLCADHEYGDAPSCDVLLVPGGLGTRTLVEDPSFLGWLVEYGRSAEYVVSVCTGSGLLAAAGLLDGYCATSNKRAFQWARGQGDSVDWIGEARWVQDRNRWTSSGVSAGIDMTLAFVAHLHGEELAHRLADGIEYQWHSDPSWDPFAAMNGLASG